MNIENLPARVNAKRAREILSVVSSNLFRKIVDANPQLVHRLPGEVRPKYLTSELLALLKKATRNSGVRTLGERSTPP